MKLSIRLLGRPSVEIDGRPRPAPRGHKAWALLALAVLSAEPPSRQRLAELLFPEADDPAGALRWNLAQLRHVLGDAAAIGGDPLRLELSPATIVDVRSLSSATWADAVRLPGLEHELLEGIDVSASPAFEAWLLAERRRVAGLAAAVLREAATARLAGGDAEAAVQLATRLVATDEFDEEAQALLIRAHVAAGHAEQARRYLSATIERFRHELGVEPSITLLRAADGRHGPIDRRPSAGRAGIRSLIDAGEAAVGAGALEAGVDTLRRAVADARRLGDEELAARALVALGTAYVHGGRGRDGEGATALHEALAAAELASADGLISEASRELGYIEFLRGRYDRAEIWLERATAIAPDGGLRGAAQAIRGALLTDRGQTQPAVELLTEAARQASAFGKPRLVAWANAFLGRAHVLREEYGPAENALKAALDAVRAANWLTFKPLVDSFAGSVELGRGNVDGAADLFDGAFTVGCQLGDPCWEGVGARGIGLVHLARGQTDEAIAWLDDARSRCLRVSDAYLWVHAYCLDALCQAAVRQQHAQAVAWVAELEAVTARTGMTELLVRAYIHRAATGDQTSMASAQLFADRIDNPQVLHRLRGAVEVAKAS